ncbi:YeeE/YedE family protein [Ilyonectria robusta]
MATILSGAVFGAAVTASGSHSLFAVLLESVGWVRAKPRGPALLGLFSQYDGNILGGSIMGLGIAIGGTCPGTALAQIGVGVPSGMNALAGATLAGILWSGFLKKLLLVDTSTPIPEKPAKSGPSTHTIYGESRMGKAVTFVALEACFGAAVYALITLTHPNQDAAISPVFGGTLLGLAQLLSMLVRRAMLGVSTSYEEIGSYFWWLVRGADEKQRPKSYSNILFSASAIAGAWAVGSAFPAYAAIVANNAVPPMVATIGGILIGLGSRIAGGCTSGHGLSGVSLFSTASFITMLSMYIAGALGAAAL